MHNAAKKQQYFSFNPTQPITHTHPFTAFFSGTTQVSRYQKGKTNLDFYCSKRQ